MSGPWNLHVCQSLLKIFKSRSQVKRTPKDNAINEVIFQTLNVLEVVDFRFISAFNIPAYIMSSEFTHKVVMKFIPAQFPCTNIFDVKVFEPILRIQRFSIWPIAKTCYNLWKIHCSLCMHEWGFEYDIVCSND